MIKFPDAELADLWRDQKDPRFLALSYALQCHIRRLAALTGGDGIYWNVDALPESTLDYLAIELRTMYYRQDYSLARKRAIIKKTLDWYTHAGTAAATQEMFLYLFDGPTHLVEWPDYDEEPFDRYTFDIVTEARVTADTYTDLWATLPKVKNARSHLRRIVILRENHSLATVGAISACIFECICYNATRGAADTASTAYVGGYADSMSDVCAANATTGSAEAAGNGYIGAAAGLIVQDVEAANVTIGRADAAAHGYVGASVGLIVPDVSCANATAGSAETTASVYVGCHAAGGEGDTTCINARSDAGGIRTVAENATVASAEREVIVPLGN